MSKRAQGVDGLVELSAGEVAALAQTLRLLGDPTRLGIALFCLGGPRAVGEIAQTLGASQTLVSHHLRLLRGAGLVRGDRRSRQVFYEVADAGVRDLLSSIADRSRAIPAA